MRQPTKGRVLKKRVWCFVEALLTRAEDSSDFEVHWETDKNTGRPNFVVKTKRRFLESLAQLKTQELTEVIKSLENLEIWDDRRLRRGKGSEIGSFALKLWSTDAQRNREQFERMWEDSRTAKSKALEATNNESKDNSEASHDEIDWRNICRTMLEKQKQLTTNRLMRADEMLFDIDRIRVDLALVERKQTDKRIEDDNPARSHLYKPDYEETQKLEYEEFLTKVLKSEQSKKIAVIGEPGAGKTTLLQRIAFWILDNTDDLPIWIPLGNFPNPAPKFKDYLLNDWLEDAITSVTPKIKAEFEERLMAGKVWLLLDGVDEMAAKSGSPLTVIANRIVGWCSCLRVVLTCRLNVWEANPYSLNGFQTYRTLEFSEEKVEEFINACFQNRKGDTCVAPTLGIQLQQALNQPGKERIKDLVRNPLRLTLLCSTWHLREGKLPDTKAELYQQFVEEVYRWQDKEKEVSTITSEERELLNAKLKELAVAAIDNETNRFSLRHKFVEGVFGDSALFQLALKVGWLNHVGVDAKNPHQAVYAFFHPTFQEYFAALAIDDWDFFLPRAHDNHNPKPVSQRYRIFEAQWKEVILLWLGREDVAREQFIQALVEFEDGCRGFYGFRAFFLAAVGIAEFRNCFRADEADEIVGQIVQWGFGYFNTEKQERQTFLDPLAEGARATLSQTDRSRAINQLVDLLEATEDEATRWSAAYSLGKIDPGNQQAIEALVRILETTKDEDTRWSAPDSLGEIGTGNQQAIEALVRILETTEDEATRWSAAYSLGKIGTGNQQAIEALARILETTEDEATRWSAVESLGEIDPGNPQAIEVLVQILETTEDEATRERAAYSLGKIGTGNQQAIEALARILETTEDEATCGSAAYNLGEIGTGNQQAIEALVRILETTKDEATLRIAAYNLGEIDPGNQQAIEALVRILEATKDEATRRIAAYSLEEIGTGNQMPLVVSALQHCLAYEVYESNFDLFNKCYNLIWRCAQTMPYSAFHQAWHQQEGVGKTTTADRQNLNQADLPQSLQSALTNDLHLICIDGSQFIDPDRPAAEIYDQMLDQNCPECDRVPETMPALKLYWKDLKRKNKRVILMFYTSSTDTTSAKGTATLNPYSETFLSDLSKFGDRICVITNQPFNHIPLKFFTPSHAIEDLMEWIRTIDLPL